MHHFGDWELFKMMIVSLREYESCSSSVSTTDETSSAANARVKFNPMPPAAPEHKPPSGQPVAVASNVPMALPPSTNILLDFQRSNECP
ncbi:uncharacterized protein LOC113468816 [Diaphorina citri]|uniref:Uncharacterized protein LOC113468816 n=1 Tax=Diaphorina citri TaxID=121845 RepID=A0A3Q0J022_DIACI|nr:uncharacterized protein LOC113468816 [Diaphorina citri]